MSSVKFFTDGIGIDENGRYVPIPMDLSKLFPKVDEEKRRKTTNIHIPPMKLVPIAEQGSRKRKLDTSTEKHSFKVPLKIAKPSVVQRLSFRASSMKKCPSPLNPQVDKRTTAVKINKVKTTLFPSGSVKVNKARKSPKNKVKTSLFHMEAVKEEELAVELKTTPVASNNKENQPGSNESLKSELEFLKLEQALASAKKPTIRKTVYCEDEDEVEGSVVEKVAHLLEADELQMKSLSEQFHKFQQEHHERMNEIMVLLKGYKARRKSRLSQKQNNVKEASPVKNVNLRKSTLKKNLANNLEGSPRTKAADLYNSLKNDCSVLCTPSNSRMDFEKASANVTRSLSRKLQEQCMLLQETPKH